MLQHCREAASQTAQPWAWVVLQLSGVRTVQTMLSGVRNEQIIPGALNPAHQHVCRALGEQRSAPRAQTRVLKLHGAVPGTQSGQGKEQERPCLGAQGSGRPGWMAHMLSLPGSAYVQPPFAAAQTCSAGQVDVPCGWSALKGLHSLLAGVLSGQQSSRQDNADVQKGAKKRACMRPRMVHGDTLCKSWIRTGVPQQLDYLHEGMLRDSPRRGEQGVHPKAP